MPMLKHALLWVTKAALIALPLAWRWRLFKRFPKAARRGLLHLPLLALCLVLALGIHQSPVTARYKLLLMSEREEIEWARARFDEVVRDEGALVLPSSDPRVKLVRRVASRLIQSLHDHAPVSCVQFPRDDMIERLNARPAPSRPQLPASATIEAISMPWTVPSSNPEKRMPSHKWDVYLIDLPKINAFVMPSSQIVVYAGMLDVTGDDEDLLAAVLAHEICHVTERHSVESLGFLALSGVLFDILRGVSFAFLVSFPALNDALAAVFNLLDSHVAHRAYSRKLESEADALSLGMMARAGFDPRAALTLWDILVQLEREAVESPRGAWTEQLRSLPLLQTHPTGEERLKDIKDHLPQAMKMYDAKRRRKTMLQGDKTQEAAAPTTDRPAAAA